MDTYDYHSDEGEDGLTYRDMWREESPPLDVKEMEAKLYYHGVGYRTLRSKIVQSGPRLVYRTSKDVWFPPTEEDHGRPRTMVLVDVPNSHLLSQNPALWDLLRNEVVEVLKREQVKFTSVDLVCFAFEAKVSNDLDGYDSIPDSDDDEAVVVKKAKGVFKAGELEKSKDVVTKTPKREANQTTLPTIWIGVIPRTLSAELAKKLSKEILNYAYIHQITGVEVAFRESTVHLSAGPPLLAPANEMNLSLCSEIIENVSTALPLFVAGAKTTMQGTLTCYFRVGMNLYGICARHVFFQDDEEDNEYTYHNSAPKKKVLLMGPLAFEAYQNRIKGATTELYNTISYIEKLLSILRRQANRDPHNEALKHEIRKNEREVAELQVKVNAYKEFSNRINAEWGDREDRVIGHVLWAPKIEVGVRAGVGVGFTRDFCILQLKKEKFMAGFSGNTLSLGPEITRSAFDKLMTSSGFDYPAYGLVVLRGILTNAEIDKPNGEDGDGESVQRVFKRGMGTKTTVGTMTKFKSHVRHYRSTGPVDSTEVTILCHPSHRVPFSYGGDSGALIVNAKSKFVALLTGGSGFGGFSDITYGTPFNWIWDFIKNKYPGANLYFDDIPEFFNQ